MPVYVYEVVLESGEPGQLFEVEQRMTDPPLTEHPTTGQPVRRVIQPPHIGGTYSDASERRLLSDENIARSGLTKYVRSGDGTYHKAAGQGPDEISAG
jgi:hypothetical protein